MSDVFGKAVWDYYRSQAESDELKHERDDGNTSDGHLSLYFSDYEDWAELTKRALEYAEGGILDAGCGAGRHALHLQNEGYEVTGVDSSPLAVRVCAERGLERVGVMDIQNLGFEDESFDTTLVIGHHLGIGGTLNDIKKTLEELSRVTKKDGILVADMSDPTATDNDEHLAYMEMNREKGRHEGYVSFKPVYNGEVGDWIELVRMGSDELAEVVEETSWKVKKVVGNNSYFVVLKKED